jgi:uncharacterized cupin superfamily protein
VNLRNCTVERQPHPAGFAHASVQVRPQVGGDQIGCSVYELPPGEQLWPYHWHLANEEWAVVVRGAPTLRTPEGERMLREGDVLGFPQGKDGAHTFTNATDVPVRIAIFSTRKLGDAFYPDSGKVGAGPPWERRYYRLADAVDYWEGEGASSSGTRSRR